MCFEIRHYPYTNRWMCNSKHDYQSKKRLFPALNQHNILPQKKVGKLALPEVVNNSNAHEQPPSPSGNFQTNCVYLFHGEIQARPPRHFQQRPKD